MEDVLIPFPTISSWWFQPIWKILVKLDHFPKQGWKYKIFETTNQILIVFFPTISYQVQGGSNRPFDHLVGVISDKHFKVDEGEWRAQRRKIKMARTTILFVAVLPIHSKLNLTGECMSLKERKRQRRSIVAAILHSHYLDYLNWHAFENPLCL